MRTWHVQLAIFWVSASFLATGIFIVPLIAGRERRGQSALTMVLLVAVAIVVFGSLAGEYAGRARLVGRGALVLAWTPGLGIPRLRQALANSTDRWSLSVGGYFAPRPKRHIEGATLRQHAVDAFLCCSRYSCLLRRGVACKSWAELCRQ